MRAELFRLPGILAVDYDVTQDVFRVRFLPGRPGVPAILSAVQRAGRRQGREFLPTIISRP